MIKTDFYITTFIASHLHPNRERRNMGWQKRCSWALGLFIGLMPMQLKAQTSDIIDVSTYAAGSPENNTNIPYINFIDGSMSSAGTVIAMKFEIRDGGASLNDPDALATILTGINFSINDNLGNNRLAFIKKAVLTASDGTLIAIGYALGTEMVFSGLPAITFTTPDNSSVTCFLRVSFDETQVIDNTKLIYTITGATTDPTGSSFAAVDAGGAFSDNNAANNRNRIEVTSTALNFSSQPTDTQVNLGMTDVEVDAVDVYGRRDVDFVSAIAVTSTGTMSPSSITVTAVAGVALFSNIVHTAGGTGVVLVARRAATSDWLAYSVTFNIITFTFANGDYRPSVDFTDFATNGDWERFNGVTWVGGQTAPQNLAPGSRPNNIYIHKIGIDAANNFSNAYNNIIILDGGELLISQDDASPATINPTQNFISANRTLEVKSGGVVFMQGDIQLANNANVIVRSGGNLVLDQNTLTNSHPFWNGIENFETNSVVSIYDWNFGAAATTASLMNNTTSISNNLAGYKFGILLISIFSDVNWTLNSSSNIINFTNNELLVLNGGTGFIQASSNAGNGGLVMNGSLDIFDGNFSFGVSSNASSYSHQNTINGTFSCQSDDALYIHRNQSGTPSSLSGSSVTFRGNVYIGEYVSSFQSNASSSNNLPNVILEGGTSVAPLLLNVFPVATAVNMSVKTGSHVTLSQNNLQLNSIASNTATFTVESNAVLDFGFGIDDITPLVLRRVTTGAAGANQFVSQQASTLKITSELGLQQVSATTGNVQISSANKSFNQLATFWYVGRSNQVTGDAISNTANGRQLIIDPISNAIAVSLSNSLGFTSDVTISATGGKLDIRKGKLLETATAAVNPGSTGTLYMADSTRYVVHTLSGSASDVIPRMDGSGFAYSLLGSSTIELAGAGAQVLRGGRAYRNISFSGSGTKTLSANTPSITGTVTMDGTAMVDADVNVLGGASTNLVMNGTSYYRMSGTGSKPDAQGLYTLNTGTTVEFANNNPTAQTIRLNPTYYKVIISGNNVWNGTTNVGLKLGDFGGSFTVKNGGVFKFINSTGFSGSFITAVSSQNNPSIILEDGSTIYYGGANQLITNQVVSSPTGANYVNLELNGTGLKSAPGEFDPPLIINGDFRNGNTAKFDHNRGTVIFKGSVAQNYTVISPFTFYNLTDSNSSTGGLVLNSHLTIENVLKLTINSKLNVGNSRVSLLSTATKTARVAPVGTGASVTYGTGYFVVQRYIPAKRAWRLITAPIDPAAGTHSISEAWQEGQTNYLTDTTTASFATQITGGSTANGFDQSNNNNSSIKYLNAGNWITPLNTNATSVKSQEGFMLFVRGDRTNYGAITNQNKPPTITTLRPRGQLFIGSKTITSSGLTVVGNPYASAVDYSTLTKTGALTGTDTYYLWDPNLGGSAGVGAFVTMTGTGGNYIATPPSSIDEYFIPSGAAFIVDFGAGGSLTFKETDKATQTTTTAFRTPASIQTMLETVENNGNTYISDGTAVLFGEQYSNGVDRQDAAKMTNFAESFGLRRDGRILSVEKRKPVTVKDTIFFNMGQIRLKNYRFTFKAKSMLADNITGYLEDLYLKNRKPIALDDSTSVDFSINNDAGSYALDRFRVVFKPLVNFTTFDAKLLGEDVHLQWILDTEDGVREYVVERSTDGQHFTTIGNTQATGIVTRSSIYQYMDRGLQPGKYVYRIKALGLKGAFAYSSVKSIEVLRVSATAYIYPNPVTHHQIALYMGKWAEGDYQISIINESGQTVQQQKIRHQSGTITEKIAVLPGMPTGHYHLDIKGPNNVQLALPFILK